MGNFCLLLLIRQRAIFDRQPRQILKTKTKTAQRSSDETPRGRNYAFSEPPSLTVNSVGLLIREFVVLIVIPLLISESADSRFSLSH